MLQSNIEDVFQYCPQCGSANPDPGATPFRCAQCGLTQFFGPVAAVGGLIVNEAGRLLLVRRACDPGKGMLGLPGGFVDRDETIEQALAREVVEETSLKVTQFDYLTSFPNVYVYGGVAAPVIDLFYVCRVESPAPIRLDPDELDSFAWLMPTETHLQQMAFASNARAIRFWLDREAAR